MDNANTYRKAVKVLQPSVAEMKRRHAPIHDLREQADKVAKARVKQYGSAKEAYQLACKERTDTEKEIDKAIRVSLLGMFRREESAN